MPKKTDIDPALPAKLIPVSIPKPWGQEIWYSGIEARGESLVEVAGDHVALSQYLGSLHLESILLLKVLDPQPIPVLGDLYFEVHESKQEVYVVTHIEPSAWADGIGKIRFGMDQNRRNQFASDQQFRQAYLEAVVVYEKIRRDIDDNQADRTEEERLARAAMEAFTATQDLRVGDVVTVPTLTPHALQHGVRVVEFQTPVYERLIVSFAQKVLTQDQWDTAEATTQMHLDPPQKPEFELVQQGIERIARFADFNVWRVNPERAGDTLLPASLPYAIVMNLNGDLHIGDLTLRPEEAALVPYQALKYPISGNGCCLIAAPGL